MSSRLFLFTDTATTEIYTFPYTTLFRSLGLHDLTGSEMSSKTIPKAHALERVGNFVVGDGVLQVIEYSDLPEALRSEEHTSELQSQSNLVCRLLLEKKKT